MSKRIIFYILFSLILGGIYYFVSYNLIFSIAVFLSFLVILVLYFERKYKTYLLISRKTNECISFINNFVITLSINNSITTTLENIQSSFSKELIEQLNVIAHISDEEKITYLENYFESPLYSIFSKLIEQFIYEGGNILDTSHLLLFDARIVEENLNNFNSISKRKLFEFLLMWIICFGILIAIKIFMGEYFIKIQKMNYFPFALFGFFLAFMVSFMLFISHSLNLRFINEGISYEKIKK